jgi:hypothetical protein
LFPGSVQDKNAESYGSNKVATHAPNETQDVSLDAAMINSIKEKAKTKNLSFN